MSPNLLLKQLLSIPSATFNEQEKTTFILDWLEKHTPPHNCKKFGESVIVTYPRTAHLPTLALVGHSDTVPPFFEVYEDGDKLYGSGASDMQGGVAAFMSFIKDQSDRLFEQFNIIFILYAKEEGTPLQDNGLYELIQAFPEEFKSIDLAIVSEPTNNTIQLGCVGSIHASVSVAGVAAHSARPWDGDNAIYNSLAPIQALSQIKRVAHTIGGVTFYDTFQLTQFSTKNGRTTVPDLCSGNVNFRFAPRFNETEARTYCLDTLINCGFSKESIKITDFSPGGEIHESALYHKAITALNVPIEAKQAWTDVAQFGVLGIPAFNFGPGLTAQAHRPDEYILMSDLTKYMQLLERLL